MQDELMGKANEILGLLAEDKNVLLTGAPATGKTTLLNLVESLFTQRGETIVDPYGPAAFPMSTAFAPQLKSIRARISLSDVSKAFCILMALS